MSVPIGVSHTNGMQWSAVQNGSVSTQHTDHNGRKLEVGTEVLDRFSERHFRTRSIRLFQRPVIGFRSRFSESVEISLSPTSWLHGPVLNMLRSSVTFQIISVAMSLPTREKLSPIGGTGYTNLVPETNQVTGYPVQFNSTICSKQVHKYYWLRAYVFCTSTARSFASTAS